MKYFIRKFLILILTVFLISLMTFVAFHVIPGDPARLILGTSASEEAVEALREKLAEMDKLAEKDDVESLSPLARDFHTALTSISGKNRILRVIEGQDEYIRRFSAMAIKQENRRSAAHEEHHRLVDLVEQKDLPAFESLMKHHIERSKECCMAALAARKQNRDL